MENINKTIEERLAALENKAKPKLNSMFNNNLGANSAQDNKLKDLYKRVELLEKRVQKLEKGK